MILNNNKKNNNQGVFMELLVAAKEKIGEYCELYKHIFLNVNSIERENAGKTKHWHGKCDDVFLAVNK